MVQQLADKGDIYKAYLAQRVRLCERDLVCKIIHPLLQAIAHTHERGVIHRWVLSETAYSSAASVATVAFDCGRAHACRTALTAPARRIGGQADACLQSVRAWCRDIKPENVFLHTGGILLGDWGLGIDDVQERPVSRVGTLDYMAPEVLSAPSIPPGVNFRVPASSREPGSYDATVRPRSLRAHAAMHPREWLAHDIFCAAFTSTCLKSTLVDK